MISIKATGGIGGDATYPYDVIMDRPYTVKEFVDEVLLEKENWGCIRVSENPRNALGEDLSVRQLRKLAKDLINCPCFQNIDGWDNEFCKKQECEFLKEEDCELQTRYDRVMVDTNPDPDFDDWLRHGMPTDPDFLCR